MIPIIDCSFLGVVLQERICSGLQGLVIDMVEESTGAVMIYTAQSRAETQR